MSKKNTLKRVPFHKGSMLEWTSNEIDEVETPRWNGFRKELYIGYCEADEWRDNEPFRATLEYVGLKKRSLFYEGNLERRRRSQICNVARCDVCCT